MLSAVTVVFLQVRSGGVGAGAEDGAGVVPAKGGRCGPGRPRAGGISGSCGPVVSATGRVGLLLRAAVGGSVSSSERRAGRPPPPSGGGRVGLLLRVAVGGRAGGRRRRVGGRAAAARGEVSGCVEMARATRGAGGQAQKGLSKPTRAAAALVD
jgi:hypothetical protein